jgi:hypothetical protein
MMALQADLSQPCGDQSNEAKPYQYRPPFFPGKAGGREGLVFGVREEGLTVDPPTQRRSGKSHPQVGLAGTGSAVPHWFHRHLGSCTEGNFCCRSGSTGCFDRATT